MAFLARSGWAWEPPPSFVFVRMPGFCVDCGAGPIRAADAFLLGCDRLVCATCAAPTPLMSLDTADRLASRARATREAFDHIFSHRSR